MSRRLSSLALLSLFASAPRFAAADETYPLVIDATGTSLMGARDLASLTRGTGRVLDLGFDHLRGLHPAIGIPARLGRSILVDAPLAITAIWVQHEAFGHAARARELNLGPRIFIAVPPPYAFDPGGNHVEWSAEKARELDLDRRILVSTEGQEAEALLMHELLAQSLRSGRWRRLLDVVLFVQAAGDLRRFDNEGSDWKTLKRLVRMQPGGPKLLEEWPGYLRWALDPLLWWALYDYFWCNLIQGRSAGSPPFVAIRNLKIFARPERRLAPWGQDLGVSAYFFASDLFAEAKILIGHRDGPPAVLLAAGATWIGALPFADLGLRTALWGQPQTTVSESDFMTGTNEPLPLTPGALVELEATLSVTDWGRLFIMAGAKSTGYLVGRPFAGGVYAQAGMVLSL